MCSFRGMKVSKGGERQAVTVQKTQEERGLGGELTTCVLAEKRVCK